MVKAYYPQSLTEALEIRSNTGAIPFAGGTDLMVKYRVWSGLVPRFDEDILFIGHLKELKGIEISGPFVEIKAGTTLTELLESEIIPEVFKEVIKRMASPGIRNMATIGGNIVNASPAGDTLPYLYAMDAELVLLKHLGERVVKIQEFIKGPGITGLQEDEILYKIRFKPKEFSYTYYRKVGTRRANALSKLSFIGLAEVYDGVLKDIRIAFGAVAPTVVREKEIEKELLGMGRLTEDLIDMAVEKYSEFIKPITDQRSTALYRKEVSLRLLKRFLLGIIKANS